MILNKIQIILAILLIVVILLQSRGTGLSVVFGGEGNIYRTKRGLEKILFITTIILACTFLSAVFLNVLF